jgi:hypothetical protein
VQNGLYNKEQLLAREYKECICRPDLIQMSLQTYRTKGKAADAAKDYPESVS